MLVISHSEFRLCVSVFCLTMFSHIKFGSPALLIIFHVALHFITKRYQSFKFETLATALGKSNLDSAGRHARAAFKREQLLAQKYSSTNTSKFRFQGRQENIWFGIIAVFSDHCSGFNRIAGVKSFLLVAFLPCEIVVVLAMPSDRNCRSCLPRIV